MFPIYLHYIYSGKIENVKRKYHFILTYYRFSFDTKRNLQSIQYFSYFIFIIETK